MEQAEERGAFPSALSYLEKAERVDAVHPAVRAARLRLLTAATIRHFQQKKPHLAAQRIAEMAELPQMKQADRPGLLAALRALHCAAGQDQEALQRAVREVEGSLGGLCASLLLFGLASSAKCIEFVPVPEPKTLKPEYRKTIPATLARVMAIGKDFGLRKFSVPIRFIEEAEKQFRQAADALDIEQIRGLGEMGIATDHPKLAWLASTAGLKRGDPAQQAFFLLLRAQALTPKFAERKIVLAGAAAELARFHRDTDLLAEAVSLLRDPLGDDSFSLTLEQAQEVARKEAASRDFPTRSDAGPDYSELLPDGLCQCPNCRRKRGETPDLDDDAKATGRGLLQDLFDMDEEEMRMAFRQGLPEDVPPDIVNSLFNVMKESFLTGEPLDKLLPQILGGPEPKQKKGRRKK